MDNKLQELTDKLYSEGLSKGKAEGEQILADAKKQAEAILAQARKQAEDILAKAGKDAEDLKESYMVTQAAFDVFIENVREYAKAEMALIDKNKEDCRGLLDGMLREVCE